MATVSKNKADLRVVSDIPENTDLKTDICKICFGSGMEIVADKGARPCVCRKKNKRDDLDRVRIPTRHKDSNFNTYQTNSVSQKKAFQFAMKLAMEFPAVEKGLLFTGPVGTGKTHLAISIIKALSERGFKCMFYEFGALLKEIQGTYNSNTKTSELNLLLPVLNAEILVLDELGASKPTDWVQDTMAYIINSRYNDAKLTIFTTNYPDKTADSRENLEDRIGIRLRSRIYEMCQTVDIDGKDFRR